MATIEQKIKYLNNRIESAQEKIQKFKNELDENPAYAFEWSTEVVRASAYVNLAKYIHFYLTESPKEETLKNLISSLEEEVIRNARSPQFSTSPMSNLVSLFTNSARTEILELLK